MIALNEKHNHKALAEETQVSVWDFEGGVGRYLAKNKCKIVS